MKIHHLDCGPMHPLMKRLVTGRAPDGSVPHMCCHVLALETDDGIVLVDSGYGTKDIEFARERIGTPFLKLAGLELFPEHTALHQLRRLGFSASDVRHIIVTHMDLDHAGGLGDFPDATLHLHRFEWEAASGATSRMDKQRYKAFHWEHLEPGQVRQYEIDGDTWRGFGAVHPLVGLGDDIAIVPLFGHSRGHTGVALRHADGWILHAGDAYFHRGCVQNPDGHQPIGSRLFERAVALDFSQMKNNQARLRSLASDEPDVCVFCAHDSVELELARTRTGGETA